MTVWQISSSLIELLLSVQQIWEWEDWRLRTGLVGPPWTEGNVPKEWQEDENAGLKHVRAFLEEFKTVEGDEARRIALEGKSKGARVEGRELLHDYFKNGAGKKWQIQDMFYEVLSEVGSTPVEIMAEEGLDKVSTLLCVFDSADVSQLPSMEAAGLNKYNYLFARAIFGPESLIGSGASSRPKTSLVRFLGRVMAFIWHKENQNVERDQTAIAKLMQKSDQEWAGAYLISC